MNKYLNKIDEGFGLGKEASIAGTITRGIRVAKVGTGRQLKTMSSFTRGLTGKNLPVGTIRGTQSIKNMNAFGTGASTRAKLGNAYSKVVNSPAARTAAVSGVGAGAGAGYVAANTGKPRS